MRVTSDIHALDLHSVIDSLANWAVVTTASHRCGSIQSSGPAVHYYLSGMRMYIASTSCDNGVEFNKDLKFRAHCSKLAAGRLQSRLTSPSTPEGSKHFSGPESSTTRRSGEVLLLLRSVLNRFAERLPARCGIHRSELPLLSVAAILVTCDVPALQHILRRKSAGDYFTVEHRNSRAVPTLLPNTSPSRSSLFTHSQIRSSVNKSALDSNLNNKWQRPVMKINWKGAERIFYHGVDHLLDPFQRVHHRSEISIAMMCNPVWLLPAALSLAWRLARQHSKALQACS